MSEQQGKLWNTVEHKTHGEYQTLVPDLVLESDYSRRLTSSAGDPRLAIRLDCLAT